MENKNVNIDDKIVETTIRSETKKNVLPDGTIIFSWIVQDEMDDFYEKVFQSLLTGK